MKRAKQVVHHHTAEYDASAAVYRLLSGCPNLLLLREFRVALARGATLEALRVPEALLPAVLFLSLVDRNIVDDVAEVKARLREDLRSAVPKAWHPELRFASSIAFDTLPIEELNEFPDFDYLTPACRALRAPTALRALREKV